eukprot:2613460-Rhodomonas_salina.2
MGLKTPRAIGDTTCPTSQNCTAAIYSTAIKGWTEHVVCSQVAVLLNHHKAGSGLHVAECTQVHVRNSGKPGEAQCKLNALIGHKVCANHLRNFKYPREGA